MYVTGASADSGHFFVSNSETTVWVLNYSKLFNSLLFYTSNHFNVMWCYKHVCDNIFGEHGCEFFSSNHIIIFN